MISKLCSILIIAFWLVMMTLLVRQEFFPDLSGNISVPPRTVVKRVFTAEDSSQLKIYYQGEEVGSADVRFEVVDKPVDPAETSNQPVHDAAYRMVSELRVVVKPEGAGATRLHFFWKSFFDEKFDLLWFRSKLRGPDSLIIAECDVPTHKLMVKLEG
jgi:hypothetical protein